MRFINVLLTYLLKREGKRGEKSRGREGMGKKGRGGEAKGGEESVPPNSKFATTTLATASSDHVMELFWNSGRHLQQMQEAIMINANSDVRRWRK